MRDRKGRHSAAPMPVMLAEAAQRLGQSIPVSTNAGQHQVHCKASSQGTSGISGHEPPKTTKKASAYGAPAQGQVSAVSRQPNPRMLHRRGYGRRHLAQVAGLTPVRG